MVAGAIVAVLSGGACGGSSVSTSPGTDTCVPQTCADLGATCGSAPDGCTSVVQCGECSSGQTCGGGGKNLCGTGTCTPTTCADVGASCGFVSDGCSKALDCGVCTLPEVCGANGHANTCGVPKKGGKGGSGGTGATGSGGTGNTGNSGGTGNTGNSGGTGNTGNSGGTGNTGNSGGTGNTGNSGGTGNTGNSGGTGNTGNSGGTGNTGNSGGTGGTGGSTSTCGGLNQKPCSGDRCNPPYAKCGPYCTPRSACCTSLSSCKGTQHCGGHGEWQCTGDSDPCVSGLEACTTNALAAGMCWKNCPAGECGSFGEAPCSGDHCNQGFAKCGSICTSRDSCCTRRSLCKNGQHCGGHGEWQCTGDINPCALTLEGCTTNAAAAGMCWLSCPASECGGFNEAPCAGDVCSDPYGRCDTKCVPKADCCTSRASCPAGQECGGHGEWQCKSDTNLCDSGYTACTTGAQTAGLCWITCG